MTELTAWLRSQLAADERIAREAKADLDSHGGFGAAGRDGPRGWHDVDGICETEYRHIDTFDPAHVLRTVAAHRAILDLAESTERRFLTGEPNEGEVMVVAGRHQAFQVMLMKVASIYEDRRGFDPSWTVSDD